ncbi:MAG: pyridoxamine 5'-phosphate oxidase family protein [Chloroflexi bacterium]|nr:pyridoxamine 5'-phosphate oxidase family protein [Chloroflexota bacterium]
MTEQEAIRQSLKLVEKSGFCLLGTIADDGSPNIKGMYNVKHEGLKKIWFSTNTSSRRVQQLRKDDRACVYFVAAGRPGKGQSKGLMLSGTVEILQDIESRKMLWSEGARIYYPLGVMDPDYCVLCFKARTGNFYHKLQNAIFDIR